jgi:ABC-type lipoprotein export system ATPase subunit/energy-coupling factor transporter ATP-binding protein EcfA2
MKDEGSLLDVIWGLLDESGLDDGTQLLVAAAVEGQAAFDEAWDGDVLPPKTDRGGVRTGEEPAGAYLSTITVEGFRGVGARAVLPLRIGPGLTVVTGRNGSGKSSFAEAVEIALTGRYSRAEGRPVEWLGGWRNLHHTKACIEIGLVVEGNVNPATAVRCVWDDAETRVDGAKISVRRGIEANQGLAALGWAEAITTYRPFLSYNELGQVLIKEPKILFDALSAILGLADLTDGVARLKSVLSGMNAPVAESKSGARDLVSRLGGSDDARAAELVALLRKKTWDLDRINEIASGGSEAMDTDLDLLNRLLYLDFPSNEQAHARIQGLREALAQVQSTASNPDIEAAGLLERALHWRQHSPDSPCPVCGQGLLTDDWAAEAQAKVASITTASRGVLTARSRLETALRACRDLIPPLPDRLAETPVSESAALASAWLDLTHQLDDAAALADHLELWLPEVRGRIVTAADQARAEIRRHEGEWRPLASSVLEWAALASGVEAATPRRERLGKASKWLADTEDRIRNQRLQPLATQAAQIWASLRQESNVELGGIMLEGAATRRRVKLDVRIDGSDSSALAVMSQGELNALALSIFLPRATVPESPFRFLVIDDPVQAMDPSKVDGLARVLHAVSRSRQVLVFTHDDRLPEALRRLQLDSTILEVNRAEGSAVQIRTVLSPVRRYWDDAAALLRDENVADAVAERVVPGVLRLALESACQQRIRQQRLAKSGVTHAQVEDLLRDQHKLYPLMALALFDDEARAGEVLNRLNSWGRSAADTFLALNKGAHHGISRPDLDGYCRDTRALINHLDQWGTE